MIIINNDCIAFELVKMYKKDLEVREQLAKTGELFKGYHPDMELVHNKNAMKLEEIIYKIGWPTVKKVGQEASYAAWIILQHAIGKPSLQRASLPLLMELAENDEIIPSEVAMLYDRICFFEMRPQRYGTQFDFDENNELKPWKIEDINNVDKYRADVGLPPLQETIKRMRKQALEQDEKPTNSYGERLKERMKWSKKVGWIK